MPQAPNFMANGNVTVCSFVKADSTSGVNKKVLLCGDNERPIGISCEAGKLPPMSGFVSDPIYAAVQGDPLLVYTLGEPCLLVIGSGGCVAGDRLKSDSSGYGVKIASSGTTIQQIGAVALATAASGEKCPVIPVYASERPALS